MDYQKRKREALLKLLSENSLAILTSGSAVKESADQSYPFSVNRNFYFLTGIDEPEVILVLVKGKKEQEVLFIQSADPLMEKWVGKTIRAKEARQLSGVRDVRYLEELDTFLEKVIHQNHLTTVYTDDENNPVIHFGKDLLTQYSVLQSLQNQNIYPIIAKMRAVKEPEEIAKMREAITVTNKGICAMLQAMKPGMKECELEAYYNFVLNQQQFPVSFRTIAAGGRRATVLHYVNNDQPVMENELILFDLGVACKRWCSDISRTFPVSGKFTKRQREIYDIVLKAQQNVFAAIKPGVTMNELQQVTVQTYCTELKRIGLIKKGIPEEVHPYYFHGVSHSLGLDVHDVGLKRDEPLQPGMVITVEPGLYIEEEGIGIRIEDDALVTENGCENLSWEIIKNPDEIETFFKNRG